MTEKGASSLRMSRALFYDRYVRYIFIASAFLLSITILFIVLFISRDGLKTFTQVKLTEFFFSTEWDPANNKFGAGVFIFGSFAVTFIALLVGGPLGLAAAVFMAKIAPPWMRAILRPATDLFVAIPSVVYGWIGLSVFVPFIRDKVGGSGYGLLAAGVILGIMILPTVITISEDSLRSLPETLEEASLALGATRWQTIWRVLIPAAGPGILTAFILAMARAIGETMAVQMVIGNLPRLPASLVSPTATLTSNIVLEMGNAPYGSVWSNALFAMALVLLLLSLILILLVRRIARRGEEVR